MILYVAEYWEEYESSNIVGIYSTVEKAVDALLNEIDKCNDDYFHIGDHTKKRISMLLKARQYAKTGTFTFNVECYTLDKRQKQVWE